MYEQDRENQTPNKVRKFKKTNKMKILKTKNGCNYLWFKKTLSFLAKGFTVTMLLVLSLGCKKANETSQSDQEAASVKTSSSKTSADETWYMAILPDTQYYTDPGGSHNGTMQMFTNQIDWILDNRTSLNIQYVAHLGDITDEGDRSGYDFQWTNANNQISRLHDANMPYGLAVGNHDQWCNGDPGSGATNNGYGTRFGKDRFEGTAPYYSTPQPRKAWYGANYTTVGSNNNDNHYDLFTVFGQKYLVMYIEYNEQGSLTNSDYPPDCPNSSSVSPYSSTIESNVTAWANTIIQANSDRKVIIVSHSVLSPHKLLPDDGTNAIHNSKHRTISGQAPDNSYGNFTTQGQKLYDLIAKPNQNVFMMLGGHITGEGYRVETQNGHVVKAFVSDYQGRSYGGNGYMRILKFNKTTGTIEIRSIQPLPGTNGEELDADSKFTVSMYN
ncbi:metallophosphoesterase [Daejeonella sp.]|uniref:metallophosphoesterase n=1 Tax=Daejeonella sp. TaxID=2805397 RepID=UPI0030C29D4C